MRLAALLLLTSACLSAPRAAPVSAEAAAHFLDSIAGDEATRQSLSAEGSVTLSQNGVPLKGELTLAASGERVRLDVAADSGQTLFALSSDAQTVTLLDFKNRRASRGPAHTTTLAAAGLEGFTAPALADLLLARLPCADGRRVIAENVVSVAHCIGSDLTATYTPRHDAAGYYLSSVVLRGANGEVSARLLGHNAAGFARRIELQTPAGRAVVVLTDVDSNVPVAEGLFRLEVPPGMPLNGP